MNALEAESAQLGMAHNTEMTVPMDVLNVDALDAECDHCDVDDGGVDDDLNIGDDLALLRQRDAHDGAELIDDSPFARNVEAGDARDVADRECIDLTECDGLSDDDDASQCPDLFEYASPRVPVISLVDDKENAPPMV